MFAKYLQKHSSEVLLLAAACTSWPLRPSLCSVQHMNVTGQLVVVASVNILRIFVLAYTCLLISISVSICSWCYCQSWLRCCLLKIRKCYALLIYFLHYRQRYQLHLLKAEQQDILHYNTKPICNVPISPSKKPELEAHNNKIRKYTSANVCLISK